MEYKSQHFVPKCHMRPFSMDEKGKSIHIFNIKKNNFIENASLKQQCAKDYFYDKTGDFEKIFNGFEGKYAEIVRLIISGKYASYDDLLFLVEFTLLQNLRTEATIQNQVLMSAQFTGLVFEKDPESQDKFSFSQKDAVISSMTTWMETKKYLHDLKFCIVKNHTKLPFITSDDPALLINRLIAQKEKRKQGGNGLIKSGLISILPISPTYLFMAYDGGIYTADVDGNSMLHLNRIKDIEGINAFQAIKAVQNLYFNDLKYAGNIKEVFAQNSNCRPQSWWQINYAVEDKIQKITILGDIA